MYTLMMWVNNNEDRIYFPYPPANFPIPLGSQNNDTYDGLSRDYRRIGTEGLISFSFGGLLSAHRRNFFHPQSPYNPMDIRDFFARHRPRQLPFRLFLLDNNGNPALNLACTVDDCDFAVRKNGDIEYSISITEYRFIV